MGAGVEIKYVFAIELSHVRGVYKKRSKQGVLYTLDRDVIKNYLEAVREYNEDAFLRPDSGT